MEALLKSEEFKPELDVEKIRSDFPILKERFVGSKGVEHPLVYLDNAATTQKPKVVIDALVNYYEHQNANVHRAIHRLGERATAAYEEARKKAAKFINAPSARQIVFTRGTTEAINLVAHAWGRKFLKPGDEILLTEMEHHSNLIPWQLVARETGAVLKFIPFIKETGVLDLQKVDELLTEKTKILSVTHMSNVFGTINPVRGLIRRAHAVGAKVLLDGAQSVPHLPVNVQELNCDFLAFSSHKMCGPTGVGVLYGKAELLEEMNPYQGGGEMISSVWLDRATYNEIPHKFEAGTPNIGDVVAFGAALDYLNSIGMDKITRYEQQLTTYALKRMEEIGGLRIFGRATERGAAISFYLGTVHPHDTAQFLDNYGVAVRAGHHCAQPAMRKLEVPATARASFYFYNTYSEIDYFVETLKKAQEFFGDGI
ncbi:MAG: SufS family cysteine desulfurase [Calditrichia bacterium]